MSDSKMKNVDDLDFPELSVEGAVATITLRRPEKANRMGAEDLVAMLDHIEAVNAMEHVLVLRLQSTGKYFCSGYNINALGGERKVSFETMADALEEARPVTIAVLQGGVYGGATDMAVACDFRIGTTDIEMFMPAARLGLHYYRSGMERYITRMGLNAAKHLFLTADRIYAHEMKHIGYLTHLVEPGKLVEATEKLAGTLSARAPLALLGMKKHLNRIARGALDEEALSRDIQAAANSKDMQEGRAAWTEKRTPRFKGH